MTEKESNNIFRFSLHQGEVLLCEKMFDADQFSPIFTRYYIDIRDILPKTIRSIQKVLSKTKYDHIIEVGKDGESNHCEYDLSAYNKKMINSYPVRYRDGMRYDPPSTTHHIKDKTIRGVPCKIGLYLNANPIVEREFFVDGFNPDVKESIDIVYVVSDVADAIFEKIKRNDIMNSWDYASGRLTINQIRDFSPHKREEMLKKFREN